MPGDLRPSRGEPASSRSHRFCYVNPKYVFTAADPSGYSSHSPASHTSDRRQGQNARRRQKERSGREGFARDSDSELGRVGPERGREAFREREARRGDRRRARQAFYQQESQRQPVAASSTIPSGDYIRRRRHENEQERPYGGYPGATQAGAAQRATRSRDRQPSNRQDSRTGSRLAGTTPLAMPEVGRADGVVQGTAPAGGDRGVTLPAFLMEPSREELLKLVEASVSKGTWRSYNTVWSAWLAFTGGRVAGGSAARGAIMDMLSTLRSRRASFDVAKKHLAGVAFLLKLHGIEDVTKDFAIRQILRGWKKDKRRVDARRPITYNLLCKLLDVLEATCVNAEEALLFRAAFMLAFFAALRISELVPASKKKVGGLLFNDVLLLNDTLRVRVSRSKTDIYGRGEWLSIGSLGARWCPVDTVRRYLASRVTSGQFLVHASGLPLTRFQFSSVLRASLREVGLEASEFGTHSFRIGAATTAELGGMNEVEVKRLGRWRSQAYKSYVRPDLMVI
ncbi:uncharacterized protein [Eleutherodactylus coqui]|uniref:uncharacterized protein n=1 Tax=Eleutherodactylus coqui TaxID=57060 RepID=UPI0034626EA2